VTDRHAGYIVVLAEDIREDDAEGTLNALRMVKGVISVTPVIADYTQAIARERRDDEWREALYALARNRPGTGERR
jgi:hypothetical protein